MNDKYDIWWRGSQMGKFELTGGDMWYQEGHFQPQETSDAKQFVDLISTFKPSNIISNPTKGTRIILRQTDTSDETNALVIALDNNTLIIRRVFDEKGIFWLLNNVH